MASNDESSLHNGSDIFFDFSCSICHEKKRNTEAEFYCKECFKFYCSKCMEYHNYFVMKHVTFGKENISQWPQTSVDAQEQSSSSDQLVEEYQPGSVSKPDPIIKVTSSKKFNVHIKGDSDKCYINGVCETSNGELLIIDFSNRKVKLLNQTYKVVDHYELPNHPVSMCSIDSSLVAVITFESSVILFIRVTNGLLVLDRTLNLQQKCSGIAHHHGNLYITSGTALYQYTVDGTLLNKFNDDRSGLLESSSCAVSPDGERIYVAYKTYLYKTSQCIGELVTLSRDGKVIAKLTDPALCWFVTFSPGLHVTDSGQVLVCEVFCRIIYQMGRDGRQKLTEVVKSKKKVPLSVFFSKRTGSLIMGMYDSKNIMVFKAQ
ncbi:uncharacterized protein LOC127874970 [Dreissena polymorpha]|uniref:B box-type domain-containing protein n=1 Tax=Dreissena polymorpha TaxID=45954 RepID=A0A9D4R3V9_DREPO|nr:uncharacterized protein LOC127874970 [Dreissena polymorpha]KAH3852315.1 hypothetical protein DPMN_094820 [Dreissena polymorpha]